MLNAILKSTKLMQTDVPKIVEDLFLPGSCMKYKASNVEELKANLSEGMLRYFYRYMIIAWYLDQKYPNAECWGWYQINGEWCEIPLGYIAVPRTTQPYYRYRGLAVTPDNMVLIIHDEVYREILETVTKDIDDWLHSVREIPGLSVVEQSHVFYEITYKVNECKEVLSYGRTSGTDTVRRDDGSRGGDKLSLRKTD